MTNKHLTSFVVLFEKFFGYNKAKSMDELHQLIKHKIYNGSWDLFRNDWSDSLELYDKLTDGIKTFEDAFERMVVTLKANNLDENQTTDFLDLTLEMYLVTSKSKGVLDNEINEDYSFNRDHPNYNKFKVFSYLEKSFGLIVADFLSSKRPLQAEQMIEGQIKFRFNNIIDEYNKNETVADMYYDALKAHENQVINVSTKSDSTDIFDSIQEICKNKEGEVFNEIKHIFRDCHDYYVEEENIGGEKVVRSGKIIFLDKKDTKEHSFSISDIYEDYDDDDFLHEVEEIKTTKPSPDSELKDYLEKKLDDCIAVNAGDNEDTVTILEISKENFNNIKKEKNFSNEILLNEICSVRFDDYPAIESVVPKEVFDEYKKIIQASLNKLSKDEDDSDEWDPEYIIHNGFIYCEKKIILLYDLPSKIYTDAESGNRERRYLY